MGTDPIAALRQLGREYHHVQQEHERESPDSATRRHLLGEMHERAARFERLLAHWVPDDLRSAWRDYLYGAAPAPDRPHIAAPPLFRGQSDRGALVEIRAADDGGHDIFVDGAHAEHHRVPWRSPPELREPVWIREEACEEQFSAPAPALDALAEFLSPGRGGPPWAWARELVEDGLVDTELSLTPRGARALERHRATGSPPRAAVTTYCVLAASGARARVLTLDGSLDISEPTLAPLAVVADLANPELRARDSEVFTESRPGLQRAGGGGPSHGVSDRRGARRRELRRRFAELALEEAARVLRGHPGAKLVVAANPAVLGELRAALGRRGDLANRVDLVGRDVGKLAPPAVHDALAEAGVLPPRGRLPPRAA